MVAHTAIQSRPAQLTCVASASTGCCQAKPGRCRSSSWLRQRSLLTGLNWHAPQLAPASATAYAHSGPSVAPLLVTAAVLVGGSALWKLVLYAQTQAIIVRMLSKYTRKGGARVLQLGGGAGDLFYYPNDTVLVTLVGEGINSGMMERAAIQAGVPVQIQDRLLTDLSFQRSNSIDSVVALFALHKAKNLPAFMDEVARVLKPNGSFVFIEHVQGREGRERLSQQLLGHGDSCLDAKALETIMSTAQLETLQVDVALQNVDPHAVGVAVKAANQVIDMDSADVKVANSPSKRGFFKGKKSKAR
ncbi:hypothetical protein WJX72_001690 [[Myrmecia] bisecta]|uniref:Methyltransferase type 11 domain-containing protein n=1 Tax=[Myrmecia] bisecta TaxID=41462 RepID=A0AAW1P337_9CHLO